MVFAAQHPSNRLSRCHSQKNYRAGGTADESQVDQVMKECDEDNNGVIDELEFVRDSVQRVCCSMGLRRALIVLTVCCR